MLEKLSDNCEKLHMKLRFWNVPSLAVVVVLQISMEAPCAAEEMGSATPADAGIETEDNFKDPSSERKFRQAEQEFVRWDTNGNFVIDEEEWLMIYQERGGAISKGELEQQPEKMRMMDSDKDGTLSDSEVNAWIRERYEMKFKRYTKSKLYKSRKAEYDKQQATDQTSRQ